MLLLRTRTLLSDVRKNTDLQSALENGNLYATVRDTDYVELCTSPMLLRNSLRQLQAERNHNNNLLVILHELLALVGLQDWAEFRPVNRQQNGKIFENFFLRMEMLRRSFQESQLGKEKIEIAKCYPTVTHQQNCEEVAFKLASSYDVVDVSCQSDFPSTNPVDAAVVKSVKAVVDGTSNNKIVRPTKETQPAYDFFFILKDSSSSKRFVQLIEPTISSGGPDSDAYFVKRYVDKLKRAESLAWDQLGIDVKDIVHTFISSGDTSGIDWATEFQDAGYSDRRILILDWADVTAFYGPMMNLLFSDCFDDINLSGGSPAELEGE